MTIDDTNMGETMIGEVDTRGRVQLSRPLREVLDIQPGDKVRLTVEKIIPQNVAKKEMQENPHEALASPELAFA